MKEKEILEKLEDITEINSNTSEKYKYLIQIAINQVKSKLKKEVDEKNPLLTMLCVSLVYFWINQIKYTNSTNGSFSGNGYKISKNTSEKQYIAASKFFQDWQARSANLLVDEGFCFYAPQKVVAKNEF